MKYKKYANQEKERLNKILAQKSRLKKIQRMLSTFYQKKKQ